MTRHHLLPKSRGGTAVHVALLCRQCHGMVHATFTNRTLASEFASLDALRAAPELAAFLKWVKKQSPDRRKRNSPRRDRR